MIAQAKKVKNVFMRLGTNGKLIAVVVLFEAYQGSCVNKQFLFFGHKKQKQSM